jgi:hypothetical protein
VAAAWLPLLGFFHPGSFINELQMEEIAKHYVLTCHAIKDFTPS